MGRINEKVDSRAAQEKREFHDDSGRDRKTGSESGSTGNQQERIDRADSSRPNFVGDGNPVTGKIIRQLIDEYANQVASKNEQKKQIEAEIVQLASRIQEFNALLEQLETNNKT